MKIIHAELAAVAAVRGQYPDKVLPEVAFVGRSNVGKSSLINALLNRKSLARVSQNPGKTRTINFYEIDKSAYFVDLPGYGYAKAPKREKEKWGAMIEEYLRGREQLKCIVLLIDIRHELSPLDLQMYEWLAYYGFKIIFVLTKLDKIKRAAVPQHVAAIRKGLGPGADAVFVPFSSETKQGREELLEALEKTLFE